MKSENVLIIFIKNILLGKVKTRLAKTVGDYGAFEVYKRLVEITEQESSKLEDCDIHVYFSDVVIASKWEGSEKYVQEGEDLGDRMKNAFKNAFEAGYKRVVGIGTDLPDMTADIIQNAFKSLENKEVVYGPASDGGYYLIGMNHPNDFLFENKAWSTNEVLNQSLEDLKERSMSFELLKELNDVDTIEDLMKSSVGEEFKELYELSRSNK